MKNVKKTINLVVVSIMIASVLLMPVMAARDERQDVYQENPTTDFVLIIDCSNSIPGTDPNHLCETACKMLMDMLPLENARIAVIGFASKQVGEKYNLDRLDYFDYIEDKDTKDYASLARNRILQETEKIRLIIPMTPISELRDKGIESYKEQMVNAIAQKGKGTFIGLSSVAAVDLLEQCGATPGNACIVLLSDGHNATKKLTFEPRVDMEIQRNIAKLAGDDKHRWPMYALQVNDKGDRSESDWKDDLQRMLQLAVDSGAGGEGEGRYCLEDFSDGSQQIATAFLNVFKRFIGRGGAPQNKKVSENQPIPFTIDSVVSEATIVVAGGGVEEILLVHGDKGRTDSIQLCANTRDFKAETQNLKPKEYYVSGEAGRYICVKLVCPEPGQWTAEMKFSGDKDSEFVFYQCNLSDMDLELTCSPTLPDTIENMSDEYKVEADFRYRGTLVKSNEKVNAQSVFEQMPVSFFVKNNVTGDVKEFIHYEERELTCEDMFRFEVKSTGYSATVSMDAFLDLFSEDNGSYSVFARVKDNMFRGGTKFSNVAGPFKNEDKPIKQIMDIEPLEGVHNKPIDEINLIPTYLENPDGDTIRFELIGEEKIQNFSFDSNELQNGILRILNCGSAVGEFNLLLKVTEPKRNANTDSIFLDYPITLRVTNAVPDYPNKLERVSLMIDANEIVKYFTESSAEESITLKLDNPDWYQDSDGDAPVFDDFRFINSDGENSVSYEWNCDRNELSIQGKKGGSGVITFTVSDGYSDPKQVSIPVEVISGWDVARPYVIAVGVFVLLLLGVLGLKLLLTRVKGTWSITATITGIPSGAGTVEFPSFHASYWTFSNKRRFLLCDLLDGIRDGMYHDDHEQRVAESIPSFFSEGSNAGKMVMKGVAFRSAGFVLKKIPSSVDVKYNGKSKARSVKVIDGTLVITVYREGTKIGEQPKLDVIIAQAETI